MSRRRLPARLWLRPADERRAATWIILDGGRQYSTGCGALDHAGAESALSAHIANRFIETAPVKERAASDVTVAEVVAHYLAVRADASSRPKELAQRADALLDWWGDKTLDDITTKTCKAYVAARTSSSQARRELEDLRSAVNLAIRDKLTRHAVVVTLPSKPKGRSAHLEADLVAKLVWAAYRKRERQRRHRGADSGVCLPTKKRPTVHVARFILVALYTGSRSGRVWQASFEREPGRPWVDLERGVFFRAADGEAVAENKQAPPIRIPPRLLAHLRRWRRMGARYVVEYHGRPADPKRAFRRLVDDVLGREAGVVRHTLRHTAATWLMQAAVDKYEVSGFLGMTLETLESTYGHHHPDHQKGVGQAFSSGRAGRGAQRERQSLPQSLPQTSRGIAK